MNAIRNYFQLNLDALIKREQDLTERKRKEVNFEREIQSSYQLWLRNLKECIRKSGYRRVLGMISKMPIEYRDCYNYFEVEILRIRCIIKIISHKTKKYTQELRENRLKERKNLEFWINQLFFSLSHVILEIRPDISDNNTRTMDQEERMNRIEYTVYYFLYSLYHLVLYSEKMNEVPQMCAYLAMCSRLDSFIIYCRKAKTLQLFIDIALLRSRMFIQNSDYPNALVSIENTMTLCFRQCFLLVDFDEGLNQRIFENNNTNSNNNNNGSGSGNTKKCEDAIIFTCFMHMIITFYQRGICYEFQGNVSKTIEAYKQSSWICTKFIKASYSTLADQFTTLLKRALCYHEVLKDILEYDTRLKERIKNETMNRRLLMQNESEDKKRQRELLQRIANGDQTSHLKRLDRTADIISKFSIKEIDLHHNNVYPKSKYITSTLNLIDFLLQDSFRPIVKQMKTLDLHCLNSDTQRRIEKQIVQSSNSSTNNFNCISNSGGLSTGSNHLPMNQHMNSNNLSQTNQMRNKYIKGNPIQYKIQRMKRLSNKSSSPSMRYRPNGVERIKVDNTFDKDYRQKKSFLEKYNSKEIKFHKNLLRSKKNEVNEKPNAVIAQCVRNSAESFVKFRLLSAKETEAQRILRNYDSQRELQFFEKQAQLENQILKSLSTKSFGEYQRNLICSRTLNTSKSQPTSLGYSCYDFSVKSDVNLDMIKKLDKETEKLTLIEKKTK